MLKRHASFLAPGLLLCSLAACSSGEHATDNAAGAEEAAAVQQALAIETAEAQAAQGVPLGSVPGQISLPPEARVAITSPFPGAAIRIFVIEGQTVSRGAPLALVRAAEPVGISADLARARSAVGLAEARATRLGQLASEGIIAQSRADEAAAQLVQEQATLAEAQRMAALSGTGADGMMTLRSPIAGRVAHVGAVTGGSVDGMEAPFVVEAGGPYRIDLQLPERLARLVRPGMAVSVDLPTGEDGETIPAGGQILSVAPSIDPATRSVMAKASIGGVPGLVAGQNVMVVISGSGSGTGVSVPAQSVTRIGGETHVFVQVGESFEPRPVTVAANAGGQAVLSAGLAAGEVVATSSITELKAASAE